MMMYTTAVHDDDVRVSFSSVTVENVVSSRNNNDYYIQQATSKAMALDIKVFRGFAPITAQEYINEQCQFGYDVSMTEAIDYLMKNYDDDGNYIMKNVGNTSNTNDVDVVVDSYVPETYFVAIYNGTEMITAFQRQHGIIGVISAHPRCTSTLLLPVGILPSTHNDHVYVANLRVHDKMQRRGVGKALMLSVIAWNQQMHDEDTTMPLVLSVDNDNTAAIRLYKKIGFTNIDMENNADDFCTMMLQPKPP
jgi:ribosomal protein S18 acetylase RimI-like enzyme